MVDKNEMVLQDAGLTPGETRVYLAMRKLGPSTVGPIVDAAGVSRSIVYQLLERLMEKGLASYITKEKTKYYQAADPGRILDYIDERSKKLAQSKEELERFLPKLMDIDSGVKTNVQVYMGFKGLVTAHEQLYNILKKGDDYYYLGIGPYQPAHAHAYWQKDHRRRIKAGITCRLLFQRSADKKILINRNSFKGCDARYMPVKMDTPAYFAGFADTVIIGLAASNTITIQIRSKEIADSFQAYFEQFWKESSPFKKQR